MRGIIKNSTYIKHEKEKSKLKFISPEGAWTINLKEVSKYDMITKKIRTIKWLTEKFRYVVTSETALSKGFFKHLGGEEKWVVPINKEYMEIV